MLVSDIADVPASRKVVNRFPALSTELCLSPVPIIKGGLCSASMGEKTLTGPERSSPAFRNLPNVGELLGPAVFPEE